MNNETLLLQKNQHWKEELVKHSSCANPSVAFAVSRKWLCIGVMETFNSNGPNVSCSVFFLCSLSCLIEHPLYYGELLVPDMRSESVIFLPLE